MDKSFKTRLKNYLKSDDGFGIKEIAVALGSIVIVGLIITAVKGDLLTSWLKDIWGWITTFIQDNITK
ncbi:hypothetical protein [Pseudobacteroides cellulosolvens]|uniref:Uncharacterized protein n=1 Tax=Pseudobacteroides cellulosolvens ATCC 35603 = DSM 2933 TaxID=398512 RepID=A0A0L6JNV1_9FIRM|nr:hypothetical protein [Pseudobacteroides cellulosolvens]KNY27516.1 hypothetical protein Bccel_2787 [Pseudobacteroides cellulosolvens ATCC 35603 = DSM 2933]